MAVVGRSLPGALAALLLVLCWVVAALAFHYRRHRVFLCASAAGFALAGMLLASRDVARAANPPIRSLLQESLAAPPDQTGPVLIEGRLRADAAPGPSGIGLVLDVERVTAGGRPQPTRGGVRLIVGGTLSEGSAGHWRAGRLVQVPATLREPARHLNPGTDGPDLSLIRRDIGLFGSVKSPALVEVVEQASAFAEMTARARAEVRARVAAHVGRWSARSSGIVTAILIGDRAGLEDEVRRRLQEAGTYHVIAISGGNIAILAGLLLWTLRTAGLAPRLAATAGISGLAAYASMVGEDPSVVRATLVAVIYLAARLVDQRSPPLNTLAITAAIIVCADPLSVVDVGFALSFGATVAILIGASPVAAGLERRLRPGAAIAWLIRPALAVLAATVCAEIALFPIGALAFSRFSAAGLLLNLAAIPLMTLVQVGGMAVVSASWLSDRLASAIGYFTHLAAVGLVDSARLVDFVPWIAGRTPSPPVPVLGIYYGGCVLALSVSRRRLRLAAAGCSVAAGLLILTGLPLPAWTARLSANSRALLSMPSGRGWLQAWFLDVGQADATLVRFPDGRTLLVDAAGVPAGMGPDIGARVVSPALWALGVRRLDWLVLTHGDPDHIGGAPAVIRDLRPREVWEGIAVPSHLPMQALAEQARRVGARWHHVRAGHRMAVGGVDVRVWHPPEPEWERQKVRNDDSVVLELRFGRVSVVLPGDVGRDVERHLATALTFEGIRMLKAAHHGSAGSSSPEWLAATRPGIAIFSAGRRNHFNHPAPAVVQRYQDFGSGMFRTDQDGAVAVATNGLELRVRTWSGRELWMCALPASPKSVNHQSPNHQIANVDPEIVNAQISLSFTLPHSASISSSAVSCSDWPRR
jgi:competence protein ComEC